MMFDPRLDRKPNGPAIDAGGARPLAGNGHILHDDQPETGHDHLPQRDPVTAHNAARYSRQGLQS